MAEHRLQAERARAPGFGAGIGSCTLAFAGQIFCDFAGYYGPRAIGTSRSASDSRSLRELPFPLRWRLASRDFWRRWHISLSSWLRDYLYIPLGGSRLGPGRTLASIAITLLLGGLWHGASWHFVTWGAYHALLLVVFHGVRRVPGPRSAPLGTAGLLLRAAAFFQLTCVGWLIFRVNSMSHLVRLLSSAWTQGLLHPSGLSGLDLARVTVLAVALMTAQLYQHLSGRMQPWTAWPPTLQALFMVGLFYAIVLFGAPVTNVFIYFRF